MKIEQRLQHLEEMVIGQMKLIDEIINYLRDKDPSFELSGLDKK